MDFVATLMNDQGENIVTVKWQHPEETIAFKQMLADLGALRLEVALELTGTYGDAFMEQMRCIGAEIFLVSPKRVQDATELYDGVPSQHDAKSAVLIARLHIGGISRPWRIRTSDERELAACLRIMDMCLTTITLPHYRIFLVQSG